MRTTFVNCGTEEKKSFTATGKQHLNSRIEDFQGFIKYGYDREQFESNTDLSEEERNAGIDFFDMAGDFYDYGLSVDYVAPNTFEKQKRGYLNYQLSWGGPSEEIRFYYDNYQSEPDKIEFVYMDWGTGIGFDVTNEEWAKWIWDNFYETGISQSEKDKAFEEL